MSLKQVIQKAKLIKVIATDVDGVLTDGSVFISSNNEEEAFARFNILDGMGVNLAHKAGINVVVISGRNSLAAQGRCRKLGIDLVYMGIDDKLAKLQEIANVLCLSLAEIAYIGDDLIDLKAMLSVGASFAPANAVYEVKKCANYVSSVHGGHGVLREVVDLILKAQDKYYSVMAEFIKPLA